ncbi:MAG: HPr family phosphocarrier protein [Paenibacillaceae bacterium]|nr:HPr family phosphocarrier protein [Paenibacillaceae bacterium]
MEIVIVIVPNPYGLHARPASLLSKLAMGFTSEITVYKNEDLIRKYNAKNVLSVMDMNAIKGDKLKFEAQGEDEKEAILSIANFARSGFGG